MAKTKKGGRTTPGKPKGRVRLIGDPILEKRALQVFDHADGGIALDGVEWADLEALDARLHGVMDREQGVGLAAPQIGNQMAMIAFHTHSRRRGTLVDPVVAEYSDERVWLVEGCLSIPGLYLEIERPRSVLVSGFDLGGSAVMEEAGGQLARILQHEIDHLDGKTMMQPGIMGARQRAVAENFVIKTRLDRPHADVLIRRDGSIKTDGWVQ